MINQVLKKAMCVFVASALSVTLTPLPSFAQEEQPTTGDEEVFQVKLGEPGELLEPEAEVKVGSENDIATIKNKGLSDSFQAAGADSGYCGADEDGKNISWTYDGKGTLTLKGSGETAYYGEYDTHWGFKVDVPGWYDYRNEITSIVIGNGITALNGSIFAHTSIKTAKLPSSVKSIATVFKGCTKMTSVELNEGLETIEPSAFSETALESLYIPSTVKELGYTIRRTISLDKITISPNNKNLLKKDNILYSYDMKTLYWADQYFSGSYKIPSTVKTIYYCAFEQTNLSSIDLGNNVQIIADGAFNLCRYLTKITIPKSVTYVGRQALSNLTNLKTADLQCSNAKFDGSIFCYSSGLESVKIAEGIKSFGSTGNAFCLCTSLKSVTLPKSFETINGQDFAACESLTSVTFGGNETSIGGSAFADCKSLKSIKLPNKLKTIGGGAFKNTPLASLVVPDSVEKIGANAFYSSTKLTIPDSLIQLEDTSYISFEQATSFSYSVKHNQTDARKMSNAVNNFRAQSGVWYWNSDNTSKTYPKNLTKLEYDKDLEDLAIKRAEELVISFSHVRPDGSSCFSTLPSDFSAYGENIAVGYASSEAAVEGWKETNENYSGQGHRRNMLSGNFNCAGYACVEFEGTKYYVQEFGYRKTPNTATQKANDSTSTSTCTLKNDSLAAETHDLSVDYFDLSKKGASQKIPEVKGTVTFGNKVINVTFNLSWKSGDSSQVAVKNGSVTSLVDNNTTYIYSYIKGNKIIISTSKNSSIKTMHRLYNKWTGEHFYTSSSDEKANLVNVGWTDEGVGWYAPASSKSPVYRLYNKYVSGGDHHYTTSVEEKDKCIKAGWTDEGIGWYSDDSKGVPLYRQYNPYAKSGTHNYTANKTENDNLVTKGWREEGVSWYGVK